MRCDSKQSIRLVNFGRLGMMRAIKLALDTTGCDESGAGDAGVARFCKAGTARHLKIYAHVIMRIIFAHTHKASMQTESGAKKRAVNLSIDAPTLDLARQLGINLSKTVDAFLKDEVKRLYWEQWNERNKEGIAEYNAYIAKHGLPLAKYRTFAKSLGDGRQEV